jgi:hypothetical protein
MSIVSGKIVDADSARAVVDTYEVVPPLSLKSPINGTR